MVSERVGKSRKESIKRAPRGTSWKADRTELAGKEKARLIQLLICGGAFVLLVAAKFLLPSEKTAWQTALSDAMQKNMDMEQVFSAAGQIFSGEDSVSDGLGELYQAVFQPEDNAVKTAALLPEENVGFGDGAVKTAVWSMSRFSMGTGSSTDWLTDCEQEDLSTSDVQDTEAVAQEQSTFAQKLQIVYSEGNLPAHTNLQQVVLGFDYSVPVVGTVSSGFGYREHPVEGEEKFHYGVDIAADMGTKIHSFAAGTVKAVGESSSYGKYLMLEHQNGYWTLYAHCSKILVTSDTQVQKDAVIAEVGETGMATGPHLHFELHHGEDYLNPIYYVEQA